MPFDDFYEELPAETPASEEPKTEEQPQEEPKDVRAHILTPEELEEFKHGPITDPVLKRAADIKAEEEPKEPEKPAEASKGETPVTIAEPNAPVLGQLEDPGEYIPSDYSFQVTIYDNDNKNPKQVTVSSVEQFDELLEKDSNFGSYAALAKAQRAADKMESKSESDYAAWEAAKAEFDTEQARVSERVERLDNIAAEMDYLVSKGKLPPVTKELKDANWSDPEIASQAGVKEQLALLKYMDKESADRRKLGLSPLTSPISALREMQLEQAETAQTTTQKRQAEARKAAGARVGGTSPALATSVPKGVSVGRVSPGGLRDMGSRF